MSEILLLCCEKSAFATFMFNHRRSNLRECAPPTRHRKAHRMRPPAPSRRAIVLTAPLLALNQLFSPPALADISQPAVITRLPQPGRLVAVGDLHGDAAVFRRVLRLVGLFDEELGGWIGGDAVLVQIGDVLDRGDEERELLDLVRRIKREARLSGGQVVTMLGNHEVLNAAGVTVYASQKSKLEFPQRESAFLAGGEIAAELATWPVACVVGDTAFCHAGLTVAQAERGLEAGNREAANWLLGRSGSPLPPEMLWPRSVSSPRSPLWMRDLSDPPMAEPVGQPAIELGPALCVLCNLLCRRDSSAREHVRSLIGQAPAACTELSQALRILGARRLVVGHTVQRGISCGCDCSVYRVDVGLSAAMGGGVPQALDISRDGTVRVLAKG